MKTLYVSDLDGTLLGPDSALSPRTIEILNRLIGRGALFTVATARTPATVSGILRGVNMELPAIVMTGAALWHPAANRYERVVYMNPEAASDLIVIYRRAGISSFIYTLTDGMIHIYHTGGKLTGLQWEFINERKNNPFKRIHLDSAESLLREADLRKVVLAYTMLPDATAAAGYAATKSIPGIRAQYYHDIYGPATGILEAFCSDATKASAMQWLAKSVGADRVVTFGDNINDLPMMRSADVAVAVEGALPEVKEAADIVIGSNADDAVAQFIEKDFLQHSV